jgi:uncharacterized protein (TIGR02246 family)
MYPCPSRRQRQSTSCLFVLMCLICPRPDALAAQPEDEAQVRQSVAAFYKAFNSHSFDRAPEFTTDDWNHINPNGGWTRGRDAVLAELKRVHSSFLKDVSDTIESMSVRFASDDVAVAIVTSRVSTYYMPAGTKHENERQFRCFIVVRRAGRWLIMQDQNTVIR